MKSSRSNKPLANSQDMPAFESVQYARLKEILNPLADKYNSEEFIVSDPISIPHLYSKKQDIEIAGFFSAIISWGNRKSIINNATKLMELMDNEPYEFILHHKEHERKHLQGFVHRTFQDTDLIFLVDFLQRYYLHNISLEDAFYPDKNIPYTQKEALSGFYKLVFEHGFAPDRTKKHIASPDKKSACKRLNMFLRWMVRKDDKNVDFGIWQKIPTAGLMIPLDVHVEKYARNFGLLTRKSLDWTAVEEITHHLSVLNPYDPILYDYALFGLGVHKAIVDF